MMNRNTLKTFAAALLALPLFAAPLAAQTAPDAARRVTYHTVKVDGLNIFYREAGSPNNPTILLLHGFPTSSHMFRDLIPQLADKYHLVAPDYPGFGNSEMPTTDKFTYTFEHLTDIVEDFTKNLKLTKYSIYVQDYGAPIGYRLATRRPEQIQAIITQNGNAYEEGLTPFWDALRAFWQDRNAATEAPLRELLTLAGTEWQYVTGAGNRELVSPDAWNSDWQGMSRPGNLDIQLALLYDYRKNPPLYPQWQAYFRQYQPPTLIVWGKNDPIFGAEGAKAFQRDLKDTELILLDGGHFALEEYPDEIAAAIRDFLSKRIHPAQ